MVSEMVQDGEDHGGHGALRITGTAPVEPTGLDPSCEWLDAHSFDPNSVTVRFESVALRPVKSVKLGHEVGPSGSGLGDDHLVGPGSKQVI